MQEFVYEDTLRVLAESLVDDCHVVDVTFRNYDIGYVSDEYNVRLESLPDHSVYFIE